MEIGNSCSHSLTRLLTALLAALCLVTGCEKKAENEKKAEGAVPEAQKGEPESRVKHGTNGEVIITLDAVTQKLMGLETAALEAASLPPEQRAYGHVLDPASLAASVADVTTAESASKASEAELARLKTLAAQSNASQRALQSAEATATRDQTQAESARLKLLASWGPAIASRQDLSEFIKSLGSQASALVEVSVPAGTRLETTPNSARVFSLADQNRAIPAKFLGPIPAVDPQMQSRGFLFLVESNAARLGPGAAVTGLVALPGEPRPGVAVPSSAVVRFNGATWLYLQTTSTNFQRAQANLEAPLAEGWFVPSGLKAGEKAVTTGAQQLLSEELKEKIE